MISQHDNTSLFIQHKSQHLVIYTKIQRSQKKIKQLHIQIDQTFKNYNTLAEL